MREPHGDTNLYGNKVLGQFSHSFGSVVNSMPGKEKPTGSQKTPSGNFRLTRTKSPSESDGRKPPANGGKSGIPRMNSTPGSGSQKTPTSKPGFTRGKSPSQSDSRKPPAASGGKTGVSLTKPTSESARQKQPPKGGKPRVPLAKPPSESDKEPSVGR